jgi:tetratricopeptide (TPR) repeat protein
MLFLQPVFFLAVLFGQQASAPSPDLAAARNAELAGRFAEAESIYEQLTAAHPDATLYQRLGLVCHLQNKFSSAAGAFEKALKLDPSLWSSHLFLGIDLYRMNRFQPAITHLAAANRLHPNEPEILFWVGATQLARHDYLEGFEALESVLERQPANADALGLLAEGYANYGTALLNEVADRFPDSAAGLMVQGKAYEFDGDYGPALAAYHRVLALAPAYPGLAEAIKRVELLQQKTIH